LFSTWGQKEAFREEVRQDGPYFFPMCGSMDESVGHVMHECVELRDEVYGRCEFDERWLVNLTRDKYFASIENLGRFLRLATEHRSRFL
jgi:hypothetical protein